MAEIVDEHIGAFRRTFSVVEKAPRGFLGIAPWVDFALLFLMFVIFQSSVVLRPGISLELPQAPFTDGIHPDVAVLTVTADGMYFFEDRRVSREVLRRELARVARERAENPALLLEADRRISYGALADIYELAREAGFRRVILATRLEAGR